jgi:anti-sigma regulatory factor (Ser/Thr protein kinase)
MTRCGLDHELFVYGDDSTFSTRLVGLLTSAIEAGDRAVSVVTPRHRELLQDTLGPAREQVLFVDGAMHYTRPLAALAGYDRDMRTLLANGSRSLSVYGEFPFDFEQEEPWRRWVAYDSILNRAFAHHPLKLTCGYDERVVPAAVMRDVRRAHPGEQFVDAPQLVAELRREPEPLPDLRELEPTQDARTLRRLLLGELRAAGVADPAAADFVAAAAEILANASRHAGGLLRLRVGRVGERFACELSDGGTGLDDPLAGYLPPKPGDRSGGGLWVARQLTDELELLSSDDGLTVRLWA